MMNPLSTSAATTAPTTTAQAAGSARTRRARVAGLALGALLLAGLPLLTTGCLGRGEKPDVIAIDPTPTTPLGTANRIMTGLLVSSPLGQMNDIHTVTIDERSDFASEEFAPIREALVEKLMREPHVQLLADPRASERTDFILRAWYRDSEPVQADKEKVILVHWLFVELYERKSDKIVYSYKQDLTPPPVEPPAK